MERPVFLNISNVVDAGEGKEIFGQVKERLIIILTDAKTKVTNALGNVFDPSYPTPDGKPFEFHWYTRKELDEVNDRLKLSSTLSNFQEQLEEKKKNGGIPRQYRDKF